MLLGAFTLREHSGDFFDIRSPLCRMTAHLAMAQYLAGDRPPGVNGRVAEAMLWTLMNNQAPALEKLSGIETNAEAVARWVRTLQAINTSDYRPLAQTQDLSPIERTAWFLAFARSVDTDVGWTKLTEEEKQAVDFARIANEEDYSVETGHQLLAVSLPLELREIATVYKLSRGRAITKKDPVDALNAMPGRCFETDGNRGVKVQVIGWGLWAGFFNDSSDTPFSTTSIFFKINGVFRTKRRNSQPSATGRLATCACIPLCDDSIAPRRHRTTNPWTTRSR